MGYHTELYGEFATSKPLTVAQKNELEDFANEAHEHGKAPSIWCQWVSNDDGTGIVWDQNEKFYNYVEWLQYIIEKFMIPWGIKLNGEVEWEGEESGDLGLIIVKDNVVTTKEGKVVYE